MQEPSLRTDAGLLTKSEISRGDEAEDVDYLLGHKKNIHGKTKLRKLERFTGQNTL